MKKLLILDLDETLFHATEAPLSDNSHDFKVEQYYVYLRPFLQEFMDFCFHHFDVAVWTSSTSLYAYSILNELHQNERDFAFVWSRSQCVSRFLPETQSRTYLKDLKKVKRIGYDLSQVIVVDDSPEKLSRNYGNLVRVPPFYGDSEDSLLPELQLYLKLLMHEKNIRSIEKRGWRRKLGI